MSRGFVLQGKSPLARLLSSARLGSAMAIGLTAATVAFIGVPKHGMRRALAPALIGAAVHLLLVLIFASNFLARSSR